MAVSVSGLSSSDVTALLTVAGAPTRGLGTFPKLGTLEFAGVILRVLLALLVVTHVLILSEEYVFHAKMLDRVSNVFVGVDIGNNADNHVTLHTSKDMSEHLSLLVATYADVASYFPTGILVDDVVTIDVTKLRYQSYKLLLEDPDEAFHPETETVSFNITESCPLGPYDPSGCNPYQNITSHDMWWYTKMIRTTVQLRNIHIRGWGASYRPVSMLWNVHIKYDLSSRNNFINLSWLVEVERYADSVPASSPQALVLIALCIVSVVLCVIEIIGMSIIPSVGALFTFGKWNLIQSISAFSNAFAAIAYFYVNVLTGQQRNAFDSSLRVISSIAYFSAWVVLVKPLAQMPSIGREGIIIVTSNGIPACLRAGLPLFLTIMGLASGGCYFFGGYYAHFNNIDLSFQLLYSLMVGDAIKDTFNGVYATQQCSWGKFLARAYVYVTVAWMYYIVLNQFFIVMEDAYCTAKVALSKQEAEQQPQNALRNGSFCSDESDTSAKEYGLFQAPGQVVMREVAGEILTKEKKD